MRISLGTLEISDDHACLIHRQMTPWSRARRHRASRAEIRAWVGKVLNAELAMLADLYTEVVEHD